MACGEPHPDAPERTCLLGGMHQYHGDAAGVWPNTAIHDTVETRLTTRPLDRYASLLEATASSRSSAPLPPARYPEPGIPRGAVHRWGTGDTGGWVEHAVATVTAWVRAHPDTEHTTAESWWPLLDAPPMNAHGEPQMRALSQVQQRLARSGVIEEVGAVRLRGVYRTRDGFEFQENKLVPVYRGTVSVPADLSTSDPCRPKG